MARSTKLKDDKVMMKSSKENEPAGENGKKKTKEERPATKVVVRRLPPTMTAEQFLQQVSPLSETDYFYFVPADMSLSPNAFCRAYINFVDQADLFIFTEKFDGYVFLDNKGGEYPAVVEFAPFQRIPKNRPNRKKDPKVGTIESDPIYIQFKEQIEAQLLENKTTANVSKQHFFETTLEPEKKEANNTPLLDFIKNKRAERQRVRDEKRDEKRKRDLERKRIKDEQKRVRKEDDTSALKPIPSNIHNPPLMSPDDVSNKQSNNSSKHTKSRNKIKEEKNMFKSEDVSKQSNNSSKHTKSSNNIKEEENLLQTDVSKQSTISSNHTRVSNKVKEEEKINQSDKRESEKASKKICDLVKFFDKSITNDASSKLFNQGNKTCNKFAKHSDIEAEMIKNSSLNRNTAGGNNYPIVVYPQQIKPQIVNFNQPNQTPFSYRGVSQLSRYISNKSLISNKNKSDEPKVGEKTQEAAINSEAKYFSSETPKANLERIVVEILGKTSSVNNKNQTKSEQKTFMKRCSGEQFTRMNSSNFYMPPRSYRCFEPKAGMWRAPSTSIKVSLPTSQQEKARSKLEKPDKETKKSEAKGSDLRMIINPPWSQFTSKRSLPTSKRPVFVDSTR